MEEVVRRRDGQQPIVARTSQLPPAFVNGPVVPMTQQDQVGEVGEPPFNPVHEVMGGAPSGRALAPGPLAVPITGVEHATGSV